MSTATKTSEIEDKPSPRGEQLSGFWKNTEEYDTRSDNAKKVRHDLTFPITEPIDPSMMDNLGPVEFSLRIDANRRSNEDCQGVTRWILKNTNLNLTVGRPQIAMLARNFVLYEYKPGEAVFEQGAKGNMFYVCFRCSIPRQRLYLPTKAL